MAREGSEGVDASLKISRRPLASKTKSVKVPPVSTPTRTLRPVAFFVPAAEEEEIFHLSFDIFHLSLDFDLRRSLKAILAQPKTGRCTKAASRS